jgi:uncharacterized protein (DUF849 family)
MITRILREDGGVLQVCLNGSRTEGVPRSGDELAGAARAAVVAGARDVHLHPKAADGRDSLAPSDVDAAVAAVRAAAPTTSVGVTTGAWAAGDPVRLIPMWTVRPDHASVNWHEARAESVAAALLEHGIAVHAGLWPGTDGPDRFLASPLRSRVRRILVEVIPAHFQGGLDGWLSVLSPLGTVLLHGEEEQAWPMLRLAGALGLDARIGLEDTLTMPDGRPAADNAALVRAAVAELARGSGYSAGP